MQTLTKSGSCSKCKAKLTIPIADCFCECKECGKTNLFLCHVIKKQQNLNVLKIKCQECSDFYTVVGCPKCQGYMGIKNFMSGFCYECSCGFKGLFVICSGCTGMLCLPKGRDFQNTKIKCKKCSHEFKYKICRTCRSCIYHTGEDQSQIFLCQNQKCPQSGSGEQGAFVFPLETVQTQKQINYRVSQFQEQAKNQSISFKDVCKVCIDLQANMINTTCYHLAMCEKCAKDVVKNSEGQCPICRTKGQYQKIFKP